MSRAAFRFAAAAALIFCSAETKLPAAADSAPRSQPTRPREIVATTPQKIAAAPKSGATPASKLAVTRIGGSEHVELDEAMAQLGLKARPRDASHKLTFAGEADQLVLEPESREALVNGLRVFLGQKISTQKGRLYVSKIDYERCLLPMLRADLLAAPLPSPKIIAVDPGHGGTDNGMENPRLGMKEKTYTLEVALRVRKLLEAAGYKVVMTRSDDRELATEKPVDWKRRSEIANAARADLLVSIHFNSLYPDIKTNGVELYSFTRQFQRSDRSQSPGQADDTERETFPVNRFDSWSALLAQSMHRAVLASLKTPDRGHKTMHSGVLRWLNCPGVLVESAFLSNDADAKLVATAAYQQQIAQAIVDGIRDYAAKLESLRPKPAATTATTR